MNNKEEFVKDTEKLKEEINNFILKWFGERCEEFLEGCESCERWKAMDMLLDNPFEGD